MPGFFITRRVWVDPFRLLEAEDPGGLAIASVFCQQAVEVEYSGALVAGPEGPPRIEGVAGRGDDFMTGHRLPEDLSAAVQAAVGTLSERVRELLGPVRFEWACDGVHVFLLPPAPPRRG